MPENPTKDKEPCQGERLTALGAGMELLNKALPPPPMPKQEMRWLTNVSKAGVAAFAQRTRCTVVVGRPKATATYTTEMIEEQGQVGVYTQDPRVKKPQTPPTMTERCARLCGERDALKAENARLRETLTGEGVTGRQSVAPPDSERGTRP